MEIDKNMSIERDQTIDLKRESRRILTEWGNGGEKGGHFVSCQDPNNCTRFWQCCFEGNCRRGKAFDEIYSFRNH